MKPHSLCIMAACLILPLCVGCTNSQVVRGQSADGDFLMQQQAKMAEYQQLMHQQQAGQRAQVQQVGHNRHRAHCPPGWKNSHKNVYQHNARPKNYQTYKYNPPASVYPQQNQPMGTVQYPYYTHTGPDDFFLK